MKYKNSESLSSLDAAPPLAQLCCFTDPQDCRDGALNMALDEVLLREWPRPWLRFYGWQQPTASIGYFGHPPEGTSEWVRRWTGGGQVHHGGPGDHTFALGIPRHEDCSRWRAGRSYAWIHSALAGALDLLGEQVSLAAQMPASASAHAACFAAPVAADLVDAHGTKLAGGAQRRCREGLLHQGSIQGPPSFPDAARQAFAEALAARTSCEPLPSPLLERARKLARSKYQSANWRAGRRR